jgi:glycosyltransferase involved in cell wall biosynthesis
VVASKTGGLPELVIPGLTGALFTAGDQDELAARLGELLELPAESRRQMGHNGRMLVRDLFDPEKCAQAQIAIYEGRSRGQLAQYRDCLAKLVRQGDGGDGAGGELRRL